MKILLIDDEPSIRRSLRRVLEQSGYEIKEAIDGEEGLKVWKEWHPNVVFLDIMMPRMNGVQVLQSRPPEAGVILISAFSGEIPSEQQDFAAQYCFIKKPFEGIEQILAVVKKVAQNVKNITSYG